MIQVHGKFKMFATDYSSDTDLRELLGNIEAWVAENKVAPKSIGVEFLEKSQNLIMSIGYRDDEHYPITLHTVKVGQLDPNLVFDKNEKDIAEAVKNIERIVCHELFITENDELHMILMCKK